MHFLPATDKDLVSDLPPLPVGRTLTVFHAPWIWLILCSTLLWAGCGREEIKVYQAPKEQPPSAANTASAHDAPPPPAGPHGASRETVHWTLPEGWQEQGASGMRAGSFSIAGPDGQKAEVAIMPFNSMGGSDLQFVNLWRSTLGLAPVEADKLPDMTDSVSIGKDSGTLYDVADPDPGSGDDKKPRILVAKVVRGDTSWFFKLAGDAELVEKQKDVFLTFLKSISFQAATAPMEAAAPPPPSQGGPAKPTWDVPAGWQEVPATSMLLAKFVLQGANGDASAEVTVSVFPGNVGGLLANVNRWRNQIGLGPVEETALNDLITSLDVEGGQAKVVDMTGDKSGTGPASRLIGAILPRGSQTWFYKLLGDASVADQQKAAFLKFIQSARYPNA